MSILIYFEKSYLQAMSSPPTPTEDGIGVVTLTVREAEEVKNEVTVLETKGKSKENTSSGQPWKEVSML